MPPIRRRRRTTADEDTPAAQPTRRSARSEEEGGSVTPLRRRRPPRQPDPEPTPPGGAAAQAEPEEDVEEAPRRRRRGASQEEPRSARRTTGRIASGWGGYDQVQANTGGFETKFKPSPHGEVVNLLEPEPFAAFARHWLDLKAGRRAFICPASLEFGEEEEPLECPLCDAGDEPNSPRAYINVAVLRAGKRPEHAVWEFGGSIKKQLQMIDKSIGRRTGLDAIYLYTSSTGSGLNTKYEIEPLYAEDLEELDPPVAELTGKQRAAFELYDESLYEIPDVKDLDHAADELAA